MYDRERSEKEKVFQFNGENIPFFENFATRSLSAGKKSDQARDYTYIIRTTEDGFDYGIQFLNVEYGPRRPAVAIFIRAGWMIPNNGNILVKKLNEMAEKTLSAIGKYVDGYDDENPQGPFQNPLSDTDFNEIKIECGFSDIEKIDVKDELSDKRIFLTEVSSVECLFENPYQKGQISSKCVIWSAWNEITNEKFPNDIVQKANISRNYLYKSLESRLFSLKLSGTEVKMKYSDPIIMNKSRFHYDRITGLDSTYLKYVGDRFVYQKTAEEAGIKFKYEIKINWTIEGAFGHTKKTRCLQASEGIYTVDYKDINRPLTLTCEDGEKEIIVITENDIKRGFMTVRSKAEEAEFIIKVSGSDFEETPITVKVDSASPAYETIKRISNQRLDIELSKADKMPRDSGRLFKNFLLIFGLVVLVIGVILLVKSLLFETSENPEKHDKPQQVQVVSQNNSNDIEEDKKYFKENRIWNKAKLKSNEAKVFYDNVLDWELDKIKDEKIFSDYAGSSILKNAVINCNPNKKDSISKELRKNTSIINLDQLNDIINKANLEV